MKLTITTAFAAAMLATGALASNDTAVTDEYDASRGADSTTGAEMIQEGETESYGETVMVPKESNLVRDRGDADNGLAEETEFDSSEADVLVPENSTVTR
ncbi:hypothetical protein [Thalassococcus sp. S3]|uniref:hypothetical protein n=1 Tax=Thalassococcus sp. S3 TaxID=2017482 RepID=UPI00102406DB|nr:hypothetical protein [Thalassococcus sp. S3]QBF31747.1 hypothetical protein CFI11_11015 [Thalassococcus sp. S3]